MKLNISSTIAEALRFSLQHAVPFYLLGLIVQLPTYLHSFLPHETQQLTLPGGQVHTAVLPRPWWETDLAIPVIDAVLLGVMVAIMVHMRQRRRRGESASLLTGLSDAAPCLSTVVAVSLTLRLAGILVASVGTLLGVPIVVLILLVPMMLLYLVFCVAMPCAATDNAGVINAFRRSAALTAGSRGRLFGLFVILFLPLAAVTMGVAMLFGGVIFSGEFFSLWFWFLGAAITVYFSALIVVIHEALAVQKEGAGAGTLATVFD